MEYNEFLQGMILENRHVFIYGNKDNRSQYLQDMARGKFVDYHGKKIPIYTTYNGFNDVFNENCEKFKLNIFQKNYFEIYIVSLIIKKLKNEELNLLEQNISYLFHKKEINNLDILEEELEISLKNYQKIYDYYGRTGQINENLYEQIKIKYAILDRVLPRIKEVITNISDFVLIIDKISEFSKIYTQVINTYINARSNKYLNIKVGCENNKDWDNYYTINGNHINYMHDYNTVFMEDYSLVRKKGSVVC